MSATGSSGRASERRDTQRPPEGETDEWRCMPRFDETSDWVGNAFDDEPFWEFADESGEQSAVGGAGVERTRRGPPPQPRVGENTAR